MGFLTLEKSKGGHQHSLVITVHFTGYAQAIPTKNKLSKATAEAVFNHFIVHYCIPKRIHSDQGTNFESNVIMGNGMCKRPNRTIFNMLGSLNSHQTQNCNAFIQLYYILAQFMVQ